jgi:hypothetical protein
MSQPTLQDTFKQYFQLEDEIQRIESSVAEYKKAQEHIMTLIHQQMKDQDIDEINVRNMKFSRMMVNPRKPKVKDQVLQSVLMKHLGGEDGKLREVMEDIAKLRVTPEDATPREVIRKRTIKGGTKVPQPS